MFTLLLLLALGGAIAYMAVYEAERSQGATGPGPTHRAEPESRTDEDAPVEPPSAPAHTEPVRRSAPRTSTTPVTVPPRPRPRPRRASEATGPPRGNWGDAPRSRTAVEGPYRLVARVPIWRKLLAVVGIVLVIVFVSGVFAALLGVVAALVSAVLDQAF